MVNAEKLVVILTGGAPWGFRLSGGGPMPLVISKIRKKSLAHRQGLKEGDAVITINGQRVHDKTQDEALELVEAAKLKLTLEICRGGGDELSRPKPKKTIIVAQDEGIQSQTQIITSSTATVQEDVAQFDNTTPRFSISASVDEVTSDAFHTPPEISADGGFTLSATIGDVSGSSYSNEQDVSNSGFTLTSSVGEMTSTIEHAESSPVLLISDGGMTTSIHSAEVEQISASAGSPILMAEPYVDSTVVVEDQTRLSPNPPRTRSRSSKKSNSPKDAPINSQIISPTHNNFKAPQTYSPNGQAFSPQNQTIIPSPQEQHYNPKPQTQSPQQIVVSPTPQVFSPQPPRVSPKPQILSPQPTFHVIQQNSPAPRVHQLSPKPQVFSPQPQQFSPTHQAFSPNPPASSPQPHVISAPPQAYSPKPLNNGHQVPNFEINHQAHSQQMPHARSPFQPQNANSPVYSPKLQAPPTSPKPIAVPKPVNKPFTGFYNSDGTITSSVSTSTFDNGNSHKEVTHKMHRSADGRNISTVHRETTITTNKSSTKFPKVSHENRHNLSSTSSAFDVVRTNGIVPRPFNTSNIILDQPDMSMSRSTGNLHRSKGPLFKPSRFVPGGEKKDPPGLFDDNSPVVDFDGNLTFGKENIAPQRIFEVKNIVSDKAKGHGRETWKPNMWISGQTSTMSTSQTEKDIPTLKDDFSPYNTFPLPKTRPGYSLVQEQKRRLENQNTRSDFDFDYYYGDDDERFKQHDRSDKMHVFAPPVEIHADGVYDSPTSPYITFSPSGEPIYMYYEDGPQSPGFTRKKNLYNDSAFYDTPSKNYPTITEQMQLCKKIAQSLTSAANRRARGAKMFMRRKRKSGKWVHEGQSDFTSSAGDVANIRELESELSPDEGGTKPLLYFKIPNLKNRVGGKAKTTKMALTQAQFERLRLESKKCEHKNVDPDTCFGIVADLKAHKGKGGRMFERRRERSDRYVIDESNSRAGYNQHHLGNVLSQQVKQEKTPWEAAMEHGGNVDAAFSHLTEWERNQRMKALLGNSKSNTLPRVQNAPPPIVNTNLKGNTMSLQRGKSFNRTAKGWSGGGEYPVAERLHHISPTRQTGPSSPATNYNSKIKAWENPGQSPYAPTVASPLPEPHRSDQWRSSQNDWQSTRAEFRPSSTPHQHNQVRPVSWMSDSFHSGTYVDDDYTYAPIDYRYEPESYPTVAYMQPIIPGTDC